VESLRNWVHRKETGDDQRGDLTTNDQEELRRLRGENPILREERKILEKAAFAWET
jgi:transposase